MSEHEVAAVEPAGPPDGTAVPPDEPALEERDRWRELLRFLPDVGRLFLDLSRDPRVPLRSKILAGAVAAYLISPIDVIPDFIPGAGQMDDIAVALWAARQLLQAAGYDVVKQRWRGSDDGFALLMVLAGIER